MNVGWERILPLEYYDNFKTCKQSVFVCVKHWDMNFQTYEKSPWYHSCTTLMRNCLRLLEIVCSTLYCSFKSGWAHLCLTPLLPHHLFIQAPTTHMMTHIIYSICMQKISFLRSHGFVIKLLTGDIQLLRNIAMRVGK